MPIYGKQITKATPTQQVEDDPDRIHTIKTFASFMDREEEMLNPYEMMMQARGFNNNLYPIWEREASECNSTGTLGTSTRRKRSIGSPYAGWLDDLSPNYGYGKGKMPKGKTPQQQYLKAHYITIEHPGMVRTEGS